MPIESWKEKAKRLKTDVHALFLAFREPNVPWYAKALMALIVGYVICPIDLIPDFIPVLGELDELIIVPAGIALVMKMIPEATMEDCRRRAREEPINSKTKWIVTAIIVAIWIFAVYIVLKLVLPLLF
ncbi:YkvA family protein [Candidatus Bathyarchaeota archaeon]|nr:YkvA family protein [Candidatus Bathyarchaeota archaeon]